MTEAQVNTITAAMFVTAMAGNPLAQKFAQEKGLHLDWGTWALAALAPGLIALAIMPWFISKVYPRPSNTPLMLPTMRAKSLPRWAP